MAPRFSDFSQSDRAGKWYPLSGLQWYPSHSHDLAMQVAAMPLSLGVSKTGKNVKTFFGKTQRFFFHLNEGTKQT